MRFILIALACAATSARADDPGERLLEHELNAVAEILVIGRRLDEGVPEIPFDAVGSRDVFGPERVRETGARNLNDLVQHIPAISTRPYNGGEASAPSFSMRGLPDDGLTEFIHVLIDGVPAPSLPYGWTAFSFLPITPERIHAIDYIRGGHTVRYSPDTVGGVLNFLTHPIPERWRATTRIMVGDQNFLSAMVSVGGTHGNIGVVATHVERDGDGYRDHGEWDQNDSNVKMRIDANENTWVALSLSFMEDFHQAPGGLTMAEFAADRFGNGRPENRFNGHRMVGDALVHHDVSETAWVEGFVQAAGTKRHLRGERPRFGDPTSISDWQDDAYFWAVGGRGQAEVGNHRLYGGLRVHREWISDWEIFSEAFPADGSPRTPVLASSFYLTTLSAHIDDTFEVSERLTVVFGARIEWVPSAKGSDSVSGFAFDSDFFTVLPGVGASFEATERIVFFANYHEGFRAPQVFGFGSARPGDSLDFEESTLIEGGVRVRRFHGLRGSLTIWRTDYDDFHLFTSDGFFENLGRIVATGADVEFEWAAGDVWAEFEGFSMLASLTVQDAELRSGVNRGNEVPYAWEQKAAWRFRYERDGWVASIGGTFVGDSFSDDANTAAASADGQIGINPSRTIWDLQIYKRMTFGENENVTLEIFGGITNLFDKDWFVHSRGGFFGGGMVAGQPRNGYIAFQLTTEW